VIKAHLLDPNGVYLLEGDDVVVSKAGKKTYGVGRFYSKIAQRPIPSLSFFALSLIDVKERRSLWWLLDHRRSKTTNWA